MTRTGFLAGWYPVLRAAALGRRPVMRTLAGADLRLARTARGDVTATDCSTGSPRPVQARDGWIHVTHDDPLADAVPHRRLIEGPSRFSLIDGFVGAGLGDVGENILDTTHTSVVHQDYLRRPGQRARVDALLEAGDDWVSATYPAGAAPGGWGARLLGAHRYAIKDTFRAPSIAEVSYTADHEPAFAARFQLTPVAQELTYVAATLAVPGGGLAARLKLAALRLFFLRIFAEDRAILELIGSNRAAHGAAPMIFAPQDLLRPGIEAILAGRPPRLAAQRMALRV